MYVKKFSLSLCLHPLLVGLLVFLVQSQPTRANERPHLVFISIDTTRADHLGFGGHSLQTSAYLDRLARESYLFSQAQSIIPLTGPAHGTMFSGLMPHTHGAIRNSSPVTNDVQLLPERLKELGYRTAGFISGWTLRSNLSGLQRGFDVYDQDMTDTYKVLNSQRFANEVTDRAVAYVEKYTQDSSPLFLFVHYYDPHDPYQEKAPWFADFLKNHWLKQEKSDKKAMKLAGYDSEIAFMDRELGRLFEALEKNGILDKSWVVLTSDHGEAFGEHGYNRHGRRVHEPALHIPMLLRPPGGLEQSQVIGERVSLVDLTPTLEALYGLAPLQNHGQSLVPLIDKAPPGARRPIYFETFTLWSPIRRKEPSRLGIFLGDLKVVLYPKKNRLKVFDLARDPQELKNVLAQHPELKKYKEQLIEWWQATRVFVQEPELSAEDLERLQQLGYVN